MILLKARERVAVCQVSQLHTEALLRLIWYHNRILLSMKQKTDKKRRFYKHALIYAFFLIRLNAGQAMGAYSERPAWNIPTASPSLITSVTSAKIHTASMTIAE